MLKTIDYFNLIIVFNALGIADIADAVGYDLRWVYRLHARGVGAAAQPQDKREH